MDIPSSLLDELLAHARAEAPNECCGVIAVEPGPPARAIRAHRAINTAASPLRFEIDGLEVLRLTDAIERDGHHLAIYHSHTRTPPYPSQTDINFAALWPGAEWVIIGLADPTAPEVRSYLIDDDGSVEEVAI